MTQRKHNDGSALQDTLQGLLKTYCRYHPGFFYRFYDTKSARNPLPAQPGDYFLLVPVGCFLLECKSTVTGTSVVTLAHHGDSGKTQIAKHKLWQRAGHPSRYLYLDKQSEKYEWHDAKNVIKKINQPLWTGHKQDLNNSLQLILEGIQYATDTQGIVQSGRKTHLPKSIPAEAVAAT